MSISRWMDKKAVVHIHNGILAIKKKAFESVLMRWMKLELIMQSEVSQKEKHQYSILLIYMEFRKIVMMTLYARQQKRHWYREQTFGLCGRGRGWDDLREWHWNMYIIICETNCQPRASCIMHWTWTGDSFHIWYYTCFNAILPNHLTLALSHRVWKTVLYICVSCCLTYRVIVTIFLNSIYMRCCYCYCCC